MVRHGEITKPFSGFTWGQLRAFAGYDLGLVGGRFGETSLGQIKLLIERWEEEQKRQDLRAGVIAAAICNTAAAAGNGKVYQKRGGEKFKPADFFASLFTAEPEGTEEEQKLAFMKLLGWKEPVNG